MSPFETGEMSSRFQLLYLQLMAFSAAVMPKVVLDLLPIPRGSLNTLLLLIPLWLGTSESCVKKRAGK